MINSKQTSITVNIDEWEMFKKICKVKSNTSASKEIQKFIKAYIRIYKHILKDRDKESRIFDNFARNIDKH